MDNNKVSYFHRDPAYGLNDWEPVIAFVRAMLENTVDENCFPLIRKKVLETNSLLSQTFIQYLGMIKDIQGMDILHEKLTLLGPENLSLSSPYCCEGKYCELICLKSIAMIGGTQAKKIITEYLTAPDKSYLQNDLEKLRIADKARENIAPYQDDYPEILKGIRSVHDLLGEGGQKTLHKKDFSEKALNAWRNLKWKGKIEFISGDGETTTFKLKNKITDHIHDFCDPFSDFGIFMSNPKVEYPIGRHRWSNSHTFLAYPIADGALYGCEYTWNTKENTITTHFNKRIPLEEVTVNLDGQSVIVRHKPISTGVELRGNVFSKENSSAVRGVWDNPEKKGTNYYAQRANILTGYKDLYYFRPLHKPIVNQLGIWMVDECERPERFFDSTGECIDIDGVIEELLIPLHEPKILAWTLEQYKPTSPNDRFAKRLPQHMRQDLSPVPPASIITPILGTQFRHDQCGYTGLRKNNLNGYKNGLDINSDGIIDEKDKHILDQHAGKIYRMNIGDYGYFGFNWLSTGQSPRSKNIREGRSIFVCSYDWGAGYNSDTGIINLRKKANPGTKLYVEYFHDVPAAPGRDNIKVYLHHGK